MKVTNVASACVLIEHQGTKLLCDPWLIDGAYGGAWYHWPPLTVEPKDFADVDYLFLSHIHPDHADFTTLRQWPNKDIPVFIAAYQQPFLRKRIEECGFAVHEVAPDNPVKLGALTLHVIPADNCDPSACGAFFGCVVNDVPGRSWQIDSLAVISGGGQRVLNVNDCPYVLSKGALDRVLQDGPIDLLLTGYAGAGPYPQCMDMPVEQKRDAAQTKRRQFLHQMQQFVEHTTPRAYVPFAGQYTLGVRLYPLNEFRGVPALDDLPADPRMVRLNRNQWIDVESGEVGSEWCDGWRGMSPVDSEVLRSKSLDHDADPEPTDLHELMLQAIAAWPVRVQKQGLSVTWTVDVQTERAQWRIASPDEAQGHLTLRLDGKLLRRILTRQFNFNNAEVGSLITFSRQPDRYDRGLFIALAAFHV